MGLEEGGAGQTLVAVAGAGGSMWLTGTGIVVFGNNNLPVIGQVLYSVDFLFYFELS